MPGEVFEEEESKEEEPVCGDCIYFEPTGYAGGVCRLKNIFVYCDDPACPCFSPA